MPMNTLSVVSAIVPATLSTYFSHLFFRENLREKPTAHISYHEGLSLIRQFLDYASRHTVDDLQHFTAQWVPCPTWVRLNDAEVVPKFLERAAVLVTRQLGYRGLDKAGGRTWWQWRRPDSPLRAEWIEMRKEYHERKRTGAKCARVILYVHGGAYYFGSVDEHRYQLQRHARKLRAQVLAPRYRLAPQFPFPCGLYDCLATYFYLLEHFPASQILFAGDSAGGGMVLSMLVTLRDQGQPLPAGTILLSPWVDLTHSFPSVAGDGAGDYIPPHGFLHKPSMAWPPPPVDEVKKASGSYGAPSDAVELPAMEPEPVTPVAEGEQEDRPKTAKPKFEQRPTFGPNQGIYLDGKVIEIKDQIQLYTTNELLAHPLVSPVMQPTLGGLPPMLIQVGGAELLRDEQIYIAHKAANPKAFLPTDEVLDKHDPRREAVNRYPPTDIQLQVWDDLCHVPHTLSFTRPAKYMYRSVAQFGAWALAHAQHRGVDIPDDDAASFISSNDGDEENASGKKEAASSMLDFQAKTKEFSKGAVGKAGDPLPPFKDHMIRQRVTRHGIIYPLPPQNEMSCLAIDPKSIGEIKAGPVRKWLAAKAVNEQRFGHEQKKIDKRRAKDMKVGYDEIPGECPPPTALVGRLHKGVAPEQAKKGKSWGLAMWSGWGSSHDENTLQREKKAQRMDADGASLTASSMVNVNGEKGEDDRNLERKQTNLTVPSRGKSSASGRKGRRTSNASMFSAQMPWTRGADGARPRSRDTRVTDLGQADDQSSTVSDSPALATRSLYSRRTSASESMRTTRPVSASGNSPIPMSSEQPSQARSRASQAPIPVPSMSEVSPTSEKIAGSENTFLSPAGRRPHDGQQAYPFRLRRPASNPSMATLDSERGTPASASHSELAGDSPAPVELPDMADSKENQPEPTAGGGVVGSALAAVGTAAAAASATVADAVMPRPSADTEKTETMSPIDDNHSSAVGATNVARSLTPPTPQVEEPVVSPVQTPLEELDRREMVSPIEEPKTIPLAAQAPAPQKENTPELKVKKRSTIFDHRTSTLGSIGADGMPSAHHDFPVRHTLVGPPSPISRPAHDEEPVPALPANLSSKSEMPQPSEEVKSGAAAATPFKLRNPVASTTPEKAPTPPPPTTTSRPAAASPEPPKPAPFKLRHTVLDLGAQKRTPSSDDARGPVPPMMPAPLNVASAAVRAKTPSPSVEKREHVERERADATPSPNGGSGSDGEVTVEHEERPPPPPPKDEKPRVLYASKSSAARKPRSAGEKSKGGGGGKPPVLGDFGFEKKAGGREREKERRPPLETFVTADEGTGVKGK